MKKWIAAAGFMMGSVAFGGVVSFDAFLTGPSESPPNSSPGTGIALVSFDTVAHMMTVTVIFSGLLGNTTASHIHCCTAAPMTGTASVATQLPSFSGFPLGVTAGSYGPMTFDDSMSSTWNPAFFNGLGGGTGIGAENALLAGIAAGEAYLNVHSSFAPSGEIRGFLVPTPEPGTLVFAAAALVGLALVRRRR